MNNHERGIVELASDAGRAITYYKMGIANESTKEMLKSGIALLDRLLDGSRFYDKPQVKFAVLSSSNDFKSVVEISRREKEYVISTVNEVKGAFQDLYSDGRVDNLEEIQTKLLEIIMPIVAANVYTNPGKV